MSKGDNYPNTVEADTIILKRHLPFSVESLLKATSSSNTLNKYNSVVSQPTLPFSQNEEIYHEKKEVKLRITTPTSIDSVNGDNKKKRRQRLTFTSSQVRILEFEFSLHRYITTENRLRLSKMLGITQQQIKIWYQNRRYKTKPGIGKKENTQNINGSFNDWICYLRKGIVSTQVSQDRVNMMSDNCYEKSNISSHNNTIINSNIITPIFPYSYNNLKLPIGPTLFQSSTYI